MQQIPQTLTLFHLYLPWSHNWREVGTNLLRHCFEALRSQGVIVIKFDFESAAFWDEPVQPVSTWQQQLELAEEVGMALRQEKVTFACREARSAPIPQTRLVFRALEEVGESAYTEAIQRVTEGTLDRLETEQCQTFGPERAAQRFFNNINDGMRYEPRLWKLAYEPSSAALVGLIAPLKMWGNLGTIGYIGVVPEHRGNGYGADLLRQGTLDLNTEGIIRIIADTDAHNAPMAKTFEQVGYQWLGRSWSYEARLNG